MGMTDVDGIDDVDGDIGLGRCRRNGTLSHRQSSHHVEGPSRIRLVLNPKIPLFAKKCVNKNGKITVNTDNFTHYEEVYQFTTDPSVSSTSKWAIASPDDKYENCSIKHRPSCVTKHPLRRVRVTGKRDGPAGSDGGRDGADDCDCMGITVHDSYTGRELYGAALVVVTHAEAFMKGEMTLLDIAASSHLS